MASSPLGSLPPMNPPALISPPPSSEAVVGSSSQPSLSQLPPPYISPSAPPLPAPPSVAVLPPAITPAASPPLPFPTPESSPPAPPTPPPVSPEAPPLPASLPEAPPPLPALLPVAPPPLPEAPPLPASQPSPQPPPPPPDLATTPSQPEIITTPVTSPLPPHLPILSPPSPPVIPSLPLPPSPPATSTPPPSPSSQVSLPPPTPPKPFFPTPSETSLPPSPSSANQHAFTAAAPLPSAPLPSGGFRPVALPLVTSANLPPVSTRQHQLSPAGLIVGCLVGGVALFLVLALLGTIIYRRSKKTNHEPKSSDINGADLAPEAQHSKQSTPSTNSSHVINVGTQASPPLTGPTAAPGSCSFHVPPAEKYPTNGLTYEELAVATNGFSDQNLVGEGGFGYVHKGVLSNGKEVAVKQLREGRKQGEKEFQAEVEIISRIHHKHLVSLLGYCIHGAKRLLVYEFVPNDTLEFHLHGIGRPVMEWGTRLRIAVGAAKGLAYLHEDCDPKILHRDIKAANILVDHNFEAKVSDFGLARSYNADASVTHISTQVVGTFGYLAPEYASSGKVTEKSDVYSYGVVLLELITGRPPICFSESVSRTSLVEWARPLLAQAVETRNVQSLVDPRLGTSYDESEMARMVSCAAACVRHSAWLRPRMTQVVRALEGDARAAMCLDKGNDLGRGYGRWKSSNYCSAQYEEDMKRFNVVLASDHSGVTGEYGLKSSSVSGRCTTSERRL